MRLVLLACCLLVFTGCSGTNYQRLDRRYITDISIFPMRYAPPTEHFEFNLLISRGDVIGDFDVKGTARPKNPYQISTYTDMTFVLYLTKFGEVVEAIHMNARTDGADIKLSKHFHTEKDFDGVANRYYVEYRR